MSSAMNAQTFVNKWRGSELSERAGYQQHFADLCALVGHGTPAELDRRGDWFTFEAGASKQSGGQGWADVWKKNHFAWEYKGPGKNLDKAYEQLLQYREALDNPPLLIVSDWETIRIHTNFTNSAKRVFEITLDNITEPDQRNVLWAAFHEPNRLRSEQTAEQVTNAAAEQFATLAEMLRRYGEDPHKTAHFLIQLLFCLFAEDIRLLPRDIFSTLLAHTGRNADAFQAQLSQLFTAMQTGGWFGVERIANFNGGLFDSPAVLQLDYDGMDVLLRVSKLDWSSIEPAIFGTLFERSLDPAKRSQLGAHYTSKEDILLIVEPVLMAPLRRKWATVQAEAAELAADRETKDTAKKRENVTAKIRALLQDFADEIASVRVLDPACGSGNFLYMALRQMLTLQKEVITEAQRLDAGAFFPSVSPAQLFGIEINPYAHELAQVTVWIGYIQWLWENGYGQPSEPVLKQLDNIRNMDAILAFDAHGQPYEPAWPEADVIIGNPPFLGGGKVRSELGDAYVEPLFKLYGDRIPNFSDLVCYWFERARAQIETRHARRAGLLATQGIRGGANRTVLERIKQSGDIFWAWADRKWVLAGAAVHVSMVAFDSGIETTKELDGTPVSTINADLSASVNTTSSKHLLENLNICFRTDEKGGPFDIDQSLAMQMLSSGNPNGRPNSDVVRPYVNGRDVTQLRRGMWVIDFGAEMAIDDAALYEAPFEYIRRVVKPLRVKSRSERQRRYWWLHRRPAPDMRKAVDGLERFIVTPATAKHRLFVWLSADIIPDHQLYAFAREDDYFFGVLHSRPHELWALRQGTQLREKSSGNRYTPTSTFETYPFPWPPGREPVDDPRVQAIAAAARELDQKRNAWLNPEGASEAELKQRTLTKLYNARPTWLDLAHKALDAAVFAAYGWPADLSDEEILERLLALNLERAG